MIEFDPMIPRWIQVADVLRARIADGTYPPGTRVPSLVDIRSEFQIAGGTAVKVLTALRDEGLVLPVTGLGSFVTEKD